MGFKSFEEMEVWQEARQLVRSVRVYAKRAIEKRDWGWADQISRSALSVMANIAEGKGSSTNPEFCQFLGYSRRSCTETRSHMYYGLDKGYITKEEFDIDADRTQKIGAMINNLISHLKKNNKPIVSNNELTSNVQRPTNDVNSTPIYDLPS